MKKTIITILLILTSLSPLLADDDFHKDGVFACSSKELTRGLVAASDYSKAEALRFMKNHNCVFSYKQTYAVLEIKDSSIKICTQNGSCKWVPTLNPFKSEPTKL